MNLLPSVIYLAWFLSEILLHRLLRGGDSADKKKQDKSSLLIIWIIIMISVNSAVALTFVIAHPIVRHIPLPAIGLGMIILGMLLRFAAIRQLGRLFTVVVTIRKDHQVKTDGLYRLIRHPAYTGSLLSFLGFALSLNNWYSLFLVFIPVTAAFIYRMNIEEEMLLSQFGQTYKDYMQRTKRVIPWVY
ncbi:methyltransferase family protein [Chitinophaga nivalis]|uniref:Isoprenylcysteine carboxylmethyltransferase family protein n=1 Tax=Chitinophaga nivalis TaxID=2991709 RepID=A0ABT3ILU3_9BACT|nr:isoprenylcysteine carboxylmethyltransferase family protein [Chitinophaga nivalis]MCW3465372.1 isoprenylcysteine carboxylmethyltransferase family protein [Chitinophaga nivalis]MCW3484936.1 isoprenylcysteine carboxylmethyltransferase family protein [Chitinophaga nivalis]